MITENHDLQVRFKWNNKNDLAIWNNRSTYHAATYDYDGNGLQTGQRCVGIRERPYFDPASRVSVKLRVRSILSLVRALLSFKPFNFPTLLKLDHSWDWICE
jgi:phage I-like protein